MTEASAPVACTHSLEAGAGQCQVFVIRRGHDGTATVEVRWPAGTTRRILFLRGTPVASDSPEPLSASRRGDTSFVTLGARERVEIPDALVFGG